MPSVEEAANTTICRGPLQSQMEILPLRFPVAKLWQGYRSDKGRAGKQKSESADSYCFSVGSSRDVQGRGKNKSLK